MHSGHWLHSGVRYHLLFIWHVLLCAARRHIQIQRLQKDDIRRDEQEEEEEEADGISKRGKLFIRELLAESHSAVIDSKLALETNRGTLQQT